jgi:putative FmdB family regulatory protein
MPLFDFKCEKCGRTFINQYVVRSDKVIDCSDCKVPTVRLFPTSVHTKIGSVVDATNVGKRIREKNEKLKKRESGYKHEQKSLREHIERKVNESLKDN